MTISNNVQTRVAYVAEATIGTTPTTPTFKTFRATGENLDAERRYQYSSELTGAKRGQVAGALVAAMGSGSVDFEMHAVTLEDFLESALRSAWSTNVLTDANTPKAFTLEATYETGATKSYKRLVGAEVSTMQINARAAEKVTGSVGFMARGGDLSTSLVTGATYTAPNTNPVHVGANVGALTLGSLTLGVIPSLTLNLNNNLRAQLGLGQLAPFSLGAGGLEVTGSLSVLLDAQSNLWRAGLDGTTAALSFELGISAGSKLRFELPVCQIEAPKIVADSPEGDTLIELQFRALQASSIANSVMRVTRNV